MAKKSILKLSVPLDQMDLSSSIAMTDQSKTEITYSDFDTGSLVIFEGEGFKVKNGVIVAGTLDTMTIVNDQGKEQMEFSGLGIKVQSLPQDNPSALFEGLLQLGLIQSNIIIGSKKAEYLPGSFGNDEIEGGGGADEIDGSAGKDVLSGGAGADEFYFSAGYGKDKILDFDADGGVGSQDLIGATYTDIIEKKTVHGNTVLDFDNGDVLTIIGVKAKDIDETDFIS